MQTRSSPIKKSMKSHYSINFTFRVEIQIPPKRKIVSHRLQHQNRVLRNGRERGRESTSEEGDMEIEACGAEREVVGVTVGGFEVTTGMEIGRVPEAASEIGEER